jgi:predicted O-linked N-acetylglucosamine transferase (SPINDLY family)
MFERHDRSRFEVTAFSFGPDTQDAMRRRVVAAFDRFVDARDLADADVAALARQLEIDIGIDLGGFTQGARTRVLAMRAAPVQLSYLGYLGTMGAEYVDYLLADDVLVPPECRQHYAEKIAYLPSYQANDTQRAIADRAFTRAELGLPSVGFVFCCFNNSYKITPWVFDAWMRVLRKVEGSVLFLYAGDALVRANLRREATLRGMTADRLVFGERLPMPEYLARYRTADLFLDTLPYNAGTTASDALWAGLPVLTCTGEALASRMAASLLHAIGLPEFVASTPEEYEALAVTLATRPDRLDSARRKLAQARLAAPLFDAQRHTRHVEAAYEAMYERYLAGLPPEHIHVRA